MKVLTNNILNNQIKSIHKGLPKNLICFSHLRWDFVFQRPQHLLTRLSKAFQIFYIEEPIFDSNTKEYYEYLNRGENITIIVPHLKEGLSPAQVIDAQKNLLNIFMKNRNMADHAFWYYTPMALDFSRKYAPEITIFDCMDELSAFKFAPDELKALEKELLNKADVVFTGGHSLYEAKKNQHSNIHAFPSSIEREHFAKARQVTSNRAVQNNTAKPKLGFYGVIDERFDIDLIGQIADARPEWEINLIGPVVKLDPNMLPKNKNINYLGSKNYKELPDFLATWDIALIPFMINESTRYISPTKTPEYLAAGKPVISTPIKDVVNPYGKNKLVHIASDAKGFIEAIEKELSLADKRLWLKRVDTLLAQNSWDNTCNDMLGCLKQVVYSKVNSSIAQ
jgi:glycosyltransferase involved in cell wall biosynthesis